MDETSISRKLDLSEAKAKYDEYAKSLLAEKIILAHILARCVSEYKGMKPEDIVPLIEGQPEISTVHLYPGETNKRTQNPEITGMNTEDSVPNEKKVVYDIHFYAYTPDEKGKVKIILDVEAQKKYHTGHDFVTRGFFYTSRMTSAQLGKEFEDPDFNSLKKVISIWICMDSPKYAENTITRYHITPEHIVGQFPTEKVRYDLMEVIMVCLSKKLSKEKDPGNLHRMLGTLLSSTMPAAQRKKVLEQEYHIPMTRIMMERSDLMCNLSEAILEDGWREGRAKGHAEGRAEGRAEGVDEGIEKLTQLNQFLLNDGRMEDLVRAVTDPAYRDNLLKEYHL